VYIEPTAAQITALAAGGSDPVTMINLLRFKPDGGLESYQKYGEGVLPILARIGARVVWQGTPDSVVIGDAEADAWDLVVLVEYPSREAFLGMATSEEYQAIAHHRTEALTDSRLIACTAR